MSSAWRYAEAGQCGLKYNKSTSAENRTLYSGNGLEIRFDRDLQNNSLQPLDVLNLANGNPLDIEFSYTTYVNHFPHYLEIIFLDVWRLLSYLSSVSHQQPFAKRFLLGDAPLNPTILSHDHDRRKQRGWFAGFHNVIQLTYPSVVFQDVSSWSKNRSTCFRSALVHRCDGPSNAFIEVFRGIASERLDLNRVHEDTSQTRVSYLSRRNSRAIEDVDAIIDESNKLAALRGLSLVSNKLFFEDLRFEKQVKAMSQVDVLVGSHGAALANLFFLPAKSHLIEITPFGLPAYFANLAEIGNVSYESLEAQPDATRISRCAQDLGDDQLAGAFANASKGIGQKSSLHSTGGRRYCLRLQNLHVNASLLAERIVHAGSRRLESGTSSGPN
jgi:Glycosyltransferase 61